MGCAYSKPKVQETEPITMDQLQKELFKFNKKIRGYLRRKNNFCLKKVKQKNPQAEERPQTKARVPCDDKLCSAGKPTNQSPSNEKPKTTTNSKEIKEDGAARVLRSVYSKTEPNKIRRSLSLKAMAPAKRSLPLQERKLSEQSQVSIADIVLSSQKSVQHTYTQGNQMSVLKYFHRDRLYHPERHYNFIREIGRGAFGQVYLARHKQILQGEEYGIKTISLEHSDERSLLMELEALLTFKHKNILALTNSYLTDGFLYIVTEYVAGMSLYSMMSNFSNGLPEYIVSHIMRECLQGLAHLHQSGFIHCDIKTENILISNTGQIKIADFGLVVRTTQPIQPGFRGTQMYASPEMANELPYGKEIDIWGLGIVAMELFQGYPPLRIADCMQCFVSMAKSGYTIMDNEAASRASEDLMNFLYNGALKYNPADRLSADELLTHPFILRHEHWGGFCDCLSSFMKWVLEPV
ncbi:aurora kinase C-like [Actinia tenebrosa]|uniref:non-specific serine/threonine protein kinase n=1 Tax=Actinia tenebrosa TaxID=6105 RepID=A0A6P8HMR5_ACTTE|nr:aurora kinase C-like [Actinia tenebrosa]